MPCAVFADPSSTCCFTANTNHPCQSGTVFFGTASADPATSASALVLTFTLTAGILINVDAFPVQQVSGWSFESDGASKRLRVTRGVGASGLPWVSFSVNVLTVLAVFSAVESVTDSPSFGMQAIALSSTSAPPAACFGPGTLVLCADGVRRDIADLHDTVHVMAVDPRTGGPPTAVAVQVYRLADLTAPSAVAQVAPCVWVTKDHTVSLVGLPRPEDVACPDVCVHGMFSGCSWIAGTLPHFTPEMVLGVFHLVPEDPEHTNFAVVVGQDETCVAELYRSSARTLTTCNMFVKCKK